MIFCGFSDDPGGGLAGQPSRTVLAFSLQDDAISLNPSPAGSLSTSRGVSKYIVARCSAVYLGHCGKPW